MITGFNTDIECDGITYHVQTEDKGLETPLILSLVYDGGTILASKRSHYDDLIEIGFDEKALAERLQKQHNLICAAIRGGRIEDLKRMTMKASASQQKKLIIEKPVEMPKEAIDADRPRLEIVVETPKDAHPITTDLQFPEILAPKTDAIANFPPKISQPELTWQESLALEEEVYFDGVEIVDDDEILPAEAVEIITEIIHSDTKPPKNLSIELLNENTFKGGERKTFSILVSNSDPVAKATVLVKILGSSFRPVIFHAKTDNNGIAVVHAQLPHFKTGRAAILFKATSGGDEVELRRSISQG